MSFPVSQSRSAKIRKSRGQTLKGCKPQLTSLVDIMTILLVFLIKSFSSEGNVINLPQDIVLPVSSAKKMPKPTVILSINNNYIVIEGEHLASVPEILRQQDMVIQPLHRWLAERRNVTEKIQEYSTKVQFKGDITIQGDKKIPFLLLQKIMYTCGQAGFNNFSLAVLQEE